MTIFEDRNADRLSYSATSEVMDASAAISLARDAFRATSQGGEWSAIRNSIERGLAHVLDSHDLDRRGGDEEVHDIGEA